MKKISVYIIALNEEARLPRTLEAVNQFADEVILVGSGSTDSTSEIARSNGAKVFYREWDNYSSQKAYAESLCSGEWLMNIDADEEVTPELASEIRMATASEKYGAYRVRISDIFPGQEKPNPLVKGYNVIRLYRRGSAQMEHTGTWDRVSLRGDGVRVGQLKGLIIHRSFVSLSQILEKYNKYTDQQGMAG